MSRILKKLTIGYPKKLRRVVSLVLVISFICSFFAVGANATDTDWVSASGVVDSYDVNHGSRAYTQNDSKVNFGSSDDYVLYSFGSFSIPAGATIDGIEVRIDAYKDSSSTRTFDLQLYNGTDAAGDSENSGTLPDSDTDTYITLGGSAYNWGYAEWTDANIDNLRVHIQSTSGGDNACLDHIEVKVYYTSGHSVTYDANGGTGAPVDGNLYTSDAEVTVLTPGAMSREGYTFAGWDSSADDVTYTGTGSEIFNMPDTDVTLSALWSPNSYTVSFDAQGGTPKPATKPVTYGSSYGALPAVLMDGFDFLGWFTASSGGDLVTSLTTVGTASDHELFAQWSEQGAEPDDPPVIPPDGTEDVPGEIYLSKTATAQGNGSWKVDLSVRAVDLVTTSDVVLVIDNSLSMDQSSRLTNAKAASITFVNNLLPAGNNGSTRIAIVSFSSEAHVRQTFTSDASSLITAINGISSDYATNTQDGFYEARMLLAPSVANNSYIVFLSDGDATQSNYPDATSFNTVNWTGGHNANRHVGNATLKTGYNSFINGSVIPYNYGNTTTDFSYTYPAFTCPTHGTVSATIFSSVNHNTSAINEAQNAKEMGMEIYTIALSAGDTGEETLYYCATDASHFFNTTDSASLEQIYNNISSSISYAATDAVVTDPMGDMFNFVGNSSNITLIDKDGNTVGTATYNVATETITWNIEMITEAMSPITMSYFVTIDPSATPGVIYPTNKSTPISYNDVNGVPAIKPFPIPEAGLEAGSIYVICFLVDASGNMITDLGYITSDRQNAKVLKSTTTTVDYDETVTITAEPTIVSGLTTYANVAHGQASESPQDVLINSANNQVYIYYAYMETAANISAAPYDAVYDGVKHSITVSGAEGYTLYYSQTNNGTDWSTTKPEFTDVTGGYTTVYVQARNGEAVVASTSATVRITPRPVSVTGNTNTVTYTGSEQSVTGFTHDALANATSDLVLAEGSVAAATSTNMGTYPMNLTVADFVVMDGTTDVTENYNIMVTDGWLEITPKAVTVNITGDNNTLVYTGSEQSETGFTTDAPAGVTVALKAGSAAEAKGTDVGTYPMNLTAADFTASGSNYTVTIGTVTDGWLKITPKAVTVDIIGNHDTVVYNGDEQKVTGFTTNAPLGVSINLKTDAKAEAKGTNVGTYQMNLTAANFDVSSANYTVTIGTVTDGWLEITPKAVTVNITGDNNTLVYTGSEQSETGFTTDAPAGVTVALKAGSAAEAKGTDVGTYPMNLTAADFTASGSNYTVTIGTVTDGWLKITPADLEIDALGNSKIVTYTGSEQSVTGFTHDALANATSDVVLAEGSVAAATGTNVGTYPMNLTAADFIVMDGTTDVTENYEITVTDGWLEITPADLEVTADEKTKVYGDTDHEMTYIVTGLIGTDTLSGDLTRATGEDTGTYAISQGTLNNSNYSISFTGADLKITERPITIKVNASSKYWGTADPTFTGSITVGELVGDDDLGITYFRNNATENNVGTYTGVLEASYTDNPNYAVTIIPGNFEIKAVYYPPEEGVLGEEDLIVEHYAYIIGRDDGLIHPEAEITRAEVATIFFRMLTDESRAQYWSQTNPYSDVDAGVWYNNAVSTLTNGGVLKGDTDGTFRPDAPITRAEFAAIAARFFDGEYTGGEDRFSDIAGHWAADVTNRAAELGMVSGYEDGTYRPQNNITRAEAMSITNNILGRAPDKDYLLTDMITWPDNTDKTIWYYAIVQEATNSHDYEYEPADSLYETWTTLLEIRDWVALEEAWSVANSSENPGDVIS